MGGTSHELSMGTRDELPMERTCCGFTLPRCELRFLVNKVFCGETDPSFFLGLKILKDRVDIELGLCLSLGRFMMLYLMTTLSAPLFFD